MSIINEKNLRALIREALTKREACCLARHSPMYGIELQNRKLYKKEERIGLVSDLADIIQNRAELSGKDWDAKKSDWILCYNHMTKTLNSDIESLKHV